MKVVLKCCFLLTFSKMKHFTFVRSVRVGKIIQGGCRNCPCSLFKLSWKPPQYCAHTRPYTATLNISQSDLTYIPSVARTSLGQRAYFHPQKACFEFSTFFVKLEHRPLVLILCVAYISYPPVYIAPKKRRSGAHFRTVDVHQRQYIFWPKHRWRRWR